MRAPKLRWILLGLAVVALIVGGRALLIEWFAAFGEWIASLGPAGLLLYAVAYVLATVLMLPVWFLTIGAGFLFGWIPAAALVFASATIGASVAFLLSRHVARERVARAAARDPRLSAIDRAIAERGWKIVFPLRMSAVVPFVLLNYVCGLSAIRFGQYVVSSAIGMVPLTLLYTGLGSAARRAGLSETQAEVVPDAVAIAILAAGFVITAAVTVYVARLTRGILRKVPSE